MLKSSFFSSQCMLHWFGLFCSLVLLVAGVILASRGGLDQTATFMGVKTTTPEPINWQIFSHLLVGSGSLVILGVASLYLVPLYCSARAHMRNIVLAFMDNIVLAVSKLVTSKSNQQKLATEIGKEKVRVTEPTQFYGLVPETQWQNVRGGEWSKSLHTLKQLRQQKMIYEIAMARCKRMIALDETYIDRVLQHKGAKDLAEFGRNNPINAGNILEQRPYINRIEALHTAYEKSSSNVHLIKTYQQALEHAKQNHDLAAAISVTKDTTGQKQKYIQEQATQMHTAQQAYDKLVKQGLFPDSRDMQKVPDTDKLVKHSLGIDSPDMQKVPDKLVKQVLCPDSPDMQKVPTPLTKDELHALCSSAMQSYTLDHDWLIVQLVNKKTADQELLSAQRYILTIVQQHYLIEKERIEPIKSTLVSKEKEIETLVPPEVKIPEVKTHHSKEIQTPGATTHHGLDPLRLATTEFNLLLDQLGLGKLHLPVPNMFQTPLWAQVLSGVCLFLSGALIYVTFLFATGLVGMIIAKARLKTQRI